MKKIILSVAALSTALAQAQVGINEEKPKATLDISVKKDNIDNESQEGLLIPRVTKEKALKMANNSITPPEESALIYVNNMTITSSPNATVEDITEKGYYFWNGTKWVKSSSANGEEWVYDDGTKRVNLKRSGQGEFKNHVFYDEHGGYKDLDFAVRRTIPGYPGETPEEAWANNIKFSQDNLNFNYFSPYNAITKNASSIPSTIETGFGDATGGTLNYSFINVDETSGEAGYNTYSGGIAVKKDAVLNSPLTDLSNYSFYIDYMHPSKINNISSLMGIVHVREGANAKILRAANLLSRNAGNVDIVRGVDASASLVDNSTSGLVEGIRSVTGLSENSTVDLATGISSTVNTKGTVNQNTVGSSSWLNIYENSTSGTVTGFRGFLRVKQGATIGKLYGYSLYTSDVAESSDITDFYGLYIEDVKGATDKNYAIYTSVGDIRFGQLKGTGERLVTANDDGVLATSNKTLADLESLWANDDANNLVKLKATSNGTPRVSAPGADRNDVTIDDYGKITAKAFIGYNGATIFPDYVFEKYYTGESTIKADYNFHNLASVESFIKTNGHLPGYKSAKEIASKGLIDLGATQLTNVEKIEELYLHTIEQDKALKAKDAKIEKLESELQAQKVYFENRLNKLEALLSK